MTIRKLIVAAAIVLGGVESQKTSKINRVFWARKLKKDCPVAASDCGLPTKRIKGLKCMESVDTSKVAKKCKSALELYHTKLAAVVEAPVIVGSERSPEGCIGTAGYSWCESLGRCVRPWETPCAVLVDPPVIMDGNYAPPVIMDGNFRPRCSEVMCMMHCEAGFVLDEYGCETCSCNPIVLDGSPMLEPCPLVRCRNPCGEFQFDSNGCQTCECVVDDCRLVGCPMPVPCEFGQELAVVPGTEGNCCGGDHYCKDLPFQCPRKQCRMFCEFGFELDEHGCELCQCAEPIIMDGARFACPEVMCAMYCEAGFEQDENGCDMCRCKEPEPPMHLCSRKQCRMYCEFGFELDEHGCELCQCAEPVIMDGSRLFLCPELMCKLQCFDGFEVDENGCEMCSCKPIIMDGNPRFLGPPEPAAPEDPCRFTACPMVACLPHQEITLVPGTEDNCCGGDYVCEDKASACPSVMCMMYCENGFEKDENGCDICTCMRFAIEGLESPLRGR